MEQRARAGSRFAVNTREIQDAAKKQVRDTLLYLTTAKANINCQDGDGFTPLHLSAKQCHTTMVKAFVDSGADLDSNDNEEGCTPLMLTMSYVKNPCLTVRELEVASEPLCPEHVLSTLV